MWGAHVPNLSNRAPLLRLQGGHASTELARCPGPSCLATPAGPRKGGLGAQHTLFQGPVLMRHTIDAYDTRGFANITGKQQRIA